MTLIVSKSYDLLCDGPSCGTTFEAPERHVNPRSRAARRGWRNGQRTSGSLLSQSRLDLCPDCVAEGFYVSKNRYILQHPSEHPLRRPREA